MPNEAPSAVTLDLWHTLIYLEPDAEEAYMEAQMELATEVLAGSEPVPGALPHSRADLRQAFESVYADAVHDAQEGRSVPPARQLERAADRLGRVPRPQAYVDGLFRLVAKTRFLPAPGVLDLLSSLHDDRRRLAVISNTVGEPGESLRPRLTALGFDPWIQCYEFSDRLPWTKPSPEIFLDALRHLEVPPDRAVHVGDGWPDVEGPKRAGFRASILYTGLQRYGKRYHALFLPPEWSDPPADYRVSELEEIPETLDRIFDRDSSP